MQFSDYYPLIIAVAAIVGGICALRVFFTFWQPIERRLNGGKSTSRSLSHFNELRDVNVNVHLRSKETLDGVIFLGVGVVTQTYPQRQFLKILLADGRAAYVHSDEIEYIVVTAKSTRLPDNTLNS